MFKTTAVKSEMWRFFFMRRRALDGDFVFYQEFDPPKAIDLETSAKVTVPDEFTQPDEENDETTVG